MATEFKEKGFDEFSKAIKDINRKMPDAMQSAASEIAQDWVRKGQSATRTPQQALAATFMRAVTDEPTGASISNDSPIFYGAEFGGQGRPTTMQFPPHKGKTGYWLFPTARANAENWNDIWTAAVDKSMEEWNNTKAGM